MKNKRVGQGGFFRKNALVLDLTRIIDIGHRKIKNNENILQENFVDNVYNVGYIRFDKSKELEGG
ncbi:hypothetical protein [Paenibacillus sp. GCM10027626]|uniref:hypothetical protein n=1 Tax=Paenibacillus sp. GCM10027626 TaxID=3273411 RepID=UPI0036377294